MAENVCKAPGSALKNAPGAVKQVTHVIFDMDGLLLDTESLYSKAAQMVLDPYGKTYTWEVKETLMGLQSREVGERMVAAYNLPISWEEYARQQTSNNQILMADTQLMPDTEVIYEGIYRQIAASFNKPFPLELRMRVMGTVEQNGAKLCVEELQLPITVEEFLARYRKICHTVMTDVKLMKGVARLVRHLAEHNIPICVGTSSSKDMFDLKTSKHQRLFSLFCHVVCGSTDPEVKAGKPAPDIFLIAASRFCDKPSPAQCLVFEDAPNGVRAAVAAGMQVVMVPDPRVSEELRKGATKVLKSLEDFKPEEFGLPPFKDCPCK